MVCLKANHDVKYLHAFLKNGGGKKNTRKKLMLELQKEGKRWQIKIGERKER